VIIFIRAAISAAAISMGLIVWPRFIAQCNWIVTAPAKALKPLARHLKNRFTSCAHFPGEHSPGNAIRGPRLRIPARHLRPRVPQHHPQPKD